MARGLLPITRSREEIAVPAEFEYVVTLSEFLRMLGIPDNEELRSFHYHYQEDKLTIKTRQVL